MTTILSFFSNIWQYLIAIIFIILIAVGGYFYITSLNQKIKLENAALAAAQTQANAVAAENQALQNQIQALQVAQAAAQSELAAIEAKSSTASNQINQPSSYSANTATAELQSLMRGFPGFAGQ